jgi:uncharacterized cupin superfamily protein
MAPAKQAIDFRLPAPGPETIRPAPERIVTGDPVQLVWNRYEDPTGRFCAGAWEGAVGAWRVQYDDHEEEFCVLLQGHVRLTGDDGRCQEFSAGDAFVVPGGFAGIWENVTPVRKLYAIMTLPPGPITARSAR